MNELSLNMTAEEVLNILKERGMTLFDVTAVFFPDPLTSHDTTFRGEKRSCCQQCAPIEESSVREVLRGMRNNGLDLNTCLKVLSTNKSEVPLPLRPENVDPLLFDEDAMMEVNHPLSSLLRQIFYARKITIKQFSDLYTEQSAHLGLSNDELTIHRNNFRKAMSQDDITWDVFERATRLLNPTTIHVCSRVHFGKNESVEAGFSIPVATAPKTQERRIDPLMFYEGDIEKAAHPLVKLLRKIFYNKRITKKQFSEMYDQYSVRKLRSGTLGKVLFTGTTKLLDDDNYLSWNTFYQVTTDVLQLNISEIDITVTGAEGASTETYSA